MSSAVRIWRASFLTLRDETLISPSRLPEIHLINQSVFSQSDSLIVAAPELPPQEVTSDVMLLIKLSGDLSSEGTEDLALYFAKLTHLIHGVSHRALLQMNSGYWALLLDSFKRILQRLLSGTNKSSFVENGCVIKATQQCLEITRRLFGVYSTFSSLSEMEQLLIFLIQVVGYFQEEKIYSSYLSDNQTVSHCNSICEVLNLAFILIGEVYSRAGSSLQVDIWQSTVEVLRKVMDNVTSKSLLLEDNILANARFYTELLHCLHLVLKEPRGYLAGHVAAFVAALKIFFRYGLANKSNVVNQAASQKIEVGSRGKKSHFSSSSETRSGPYMPPHLRKKVLENPPQKDEEFMFSPEYDSSLSYPSSSDSECSDNDGTMTDSCNVLLAKTRLAAITCIQDLCRADPKSFTAQWSTVLPSGDVLHPRKYETTLMSCLLFDPYLKVRLEAGSSIMAMLDGPASVFLQVAEFKGSLKCGSFTALSSSLGQILMQLHIGVLYLIKHEKHRRLLLLSFNILMLLLSCTPYSRMSEDLLSMVISSVESRINEEFSFQRDRHALLAAAVNCLRIALSVSPSSMCVNNMLLAEVSKGFVGGQQNSHVISTLCRFSEQVSSPSISLEASQALKAVAHNYPNVIGLCWERISSIIHGVFSISEVPVRSWRGNVEHNVSIQERVITTAVKVLDESLRAISGFKGTEDFSNDKFPDSPFTSDFIKTKSISSAPSYSSNTPASMVDQTEICLLASERWIEATVKHFPVIITHSSAMVRAAAVTCFAGMTSSVFFSLPEDKQEYIIRCTINAALSDEVPSVRSAACRAIGVIACFPETYLSSQILMEFINTVEYNTRDPLVSVRITASWALANICDSLGGSIESRKTSQFIQLLLNSSLRLTCDNDKVKANAVRALGNLSRFVHFASQSGSKDFKHFNLESDVTEPSRDDEREMSDSFTSTSPGNSDWLGKMVQAFLSCVTTGNVKVQWNVCHALSNLFGNRSLKLENMEWSSSVFSVLLLLVRDSSNFKIRIQAAVALSVPENTNDYGQSYYDVFKGVGHIIENFKSDHVSEPSNFKYWIALEKQLTSTMLHLVGLAATCDQPAVPDFLIKKASFLEGWIKGLCTSVGDASSSFNGPNHITSMNQKKDIISRALHALIEVYESRNHHSIAKKFHRLANSLL